MCTHKNTHELTVLLVSHGICVVLINPYELVSEAIENISRGEMVFPNLDFRIIVWLYTEPIDGMQMREIG